jgi:hypothetical protein
MEIFEFEESIVIHGNMGAWVRVMGGLGGPGAEGQGKFVW